LEELHTLILGMGAIAAGLAFWLARTHEILIEAEKELIEAKEELAFLKNVLRDVAMGDAHVWVGDDGEVRAARAIAGNTSIH
jgi:hypothetical protein